MNYLCHDSLFPSGNVSGCPSSGLAWGSLKRCGTSGGGGSELPLQLEGSCLPPSAPEIEGLGFQPQRVNTTFPFLSQPQRPRQGRGALSVGLLPFFKPQERKKNSNQNNFSVLPQNKVRDGREQSQGWEGQGLRLISALPQGLEPWEEAHSCVPKCLPVLQALACPG